MYYNLLTTSVNKFKITINTTKPTYHSTDSSTKLVSHDGGSTIDVIKNNKVTNSNAISTKAKLITQS